MKADFDPFDKQRFLAVMPLFSDLSNEERIRLAEGCQLKLSLIHI